MIRQQAAIQMKDVRVRLSGTEILRGISGIVPRGCLIGLVGPNGSGKSTLLRAISGQTPLSGGSVLLDDVPLNRLSRRKIAQSVCLLPQDASVAVPFSVRDVVAMGRNPHLGRFQSFGERDAEVVDWAMQQATVQDLAARPVTTLSGGERQRTLLARSLATQAPTLLLDEPTNSLDILHQLEVVSLLQQFAQQEKTIVVALHDLNVARRICSHVLLLDQGSVIAEGDAESTLNPANVERVFGVAVAESDQRGLVFTLPDVGEV